VTIKRLLSITSIMLFALIVVACAPAQPEPGAAPAGDTAGGATETPEQAEQVAAEALPAARLALADYLQTTPEQIEMQQIEDAQWPNACLGLAGPDEMCAEVITPGYLITFTYEGESYAVRTDLDGNAVRVEAAAATAPAAGDDLPLPVPLARQALARELGVAPENIEILSFEQQEWRDSCLGLGGPAESCLAVITPGWRVMLGVEGQAYEVRTDETGQSVRIAPAQADKPAGEIPGPDLNGAVLFYQRSGGIAGELLTVRVYANGTVERTVGPPEPEAAVQMAPVDPAAVETLLADLETAGYFELERSYLPEDTCCDRILYLIGAEQDGRVHTVEALEATPDLPPAVGESVSLIETFIAGAFGE